MEVTIIYDNTAYKEGLIADWGFSCLIEAENSPKILFDTGADGKILIGNMEKLGMDPDSIDEVFISHAHYDHIGGLPEFLSKNSKAKVYITPSAGRLKSRAAVTFCGPAKIHENIFSTGELDGIEQSMGVLTDKGIVLFVGCSHPYMGRILAASRKFGDLYAIIGGLHSFSEFELFEDFELICPAHCTRYKAKLKKMFPLKYVEGGAGKKIKIGDPA